MAVKSKEQRSAVLQSLKDTDLNNVRLAAEADKTRPGAAALIDEIRQIQAARRAAKAAKAGADLLGGLL